MGTVPTRRLRGGLEMPVLGLGTYRMHDEAAAVAVRSALEAGYRLIDTAALYDNETGVGKGIADSEVPRGEILVQTKLRGVDQGFDQALRAFDASRARLGLDYVDLYLIHWPLPRLDRYVDSWRALLKLRDEGLVRDVGVSNFTVAHLDRLVAETGVAPVVNQVELHPFFIQEDLLAQDTAAGIATQAWQPLARKTSLLAEPALAAIAAGHGVTPAQVVLRWHLQRGVIPIPKSATPARRRANLDVFDFALSAEEMAAVADRPQARSGADPDDPGLE
jgi:diketogulonate reductase-like aldo/keto reductase